MPSLAAPQAPGQSSSSAMWRASSNPASSSAEALAMPRADEGGSSGALTPPIVGSAPDTTFRDVRVIGFLVALGPGETRKMQRACQMANRRLAWFLDERVADLPGMVLPAGEAVDQQLRRPADRRNGRQLESSIGRTPVDGTANHQAPHEHRPACPHANGGILW